MGEEGSDGRLVLALLSDATSLHVLPFERNARFSVLPLDCLLVESLAQKTSLQKKRGQLKTAAIIPRGTRLLPQMKTANAIF